MQDGIYQVTYGGQGPHGEALVVVNGTSLNGGGPLYLLQGTLKHSTNPISGTLYVKRWSESVAENKLSFPLGSYTLILQGMGTRTTFEASGLGPGGISITLVGKHIADLA